ncbi:hypothetical protein [Kandleria vitulina]|jgi:hypothetical protein|uniref:hypothetical protein n=1 Tax=Kandleria vitulina TaxID=1630 RepID=UPI00048BFC4E|nr:hypothetical protein [Kandleria vitulina]
MPIIDDLKTFASQAMDEIEDAVEETKIKSQAKSISKEIMRNYAIIGKYYYEAFKNGETIPEELINTFRAIDEEQEELKKIEEKLKQY